MYSIFGWSYGQVKVYVFCMCYVVFRECARATQVVDLASAELYMSMYLEAAGCELWWLDMYWELY